MADPAPKAPPAPSEVFVVAPDGGTYAFPLDQAAEAIRRGARLETPEERRTREVEKRQEGQEIRTAIEGGLRGASIGVSDVAGALFGMSEGMSERREAFPTLSTGSEIIGGLTGLGKGGAAKTVVGKGLKAVAAPARGVFRAGQTVEKLVEGATKGLAGRGVLGKMAAKGLSVGSGAGVEGALVGAQQWMTESVLGEAEPTAGALLDHVGAGVMFGGLLGGGLGALGEGAAAGLTRGAKALRGVMPEGKALQDGVEDLWAKGAATATGIDEDAARAVINGRDAIPAAMAAPEELGARMATVKDEFSELFDDIASNHRGLKKLDFEEKVAAAEVDKDQLSKALFGTASELTEDDRVNMVVDQILTTVPENHRGAVGLRGLYDDETIGALRPSRVWDDGTPTEELLPGTSTVEISRQYDANNIDRLRRDVRKALRAMKETKYGDGRIGIVTGTASDVTGADQLELLVKDADLIGELRAEGEGIREGFYPRVEAALDAAIADPGVAGSSQLKQLRKIIKGKRAEAASGKMSVGELIKDQDDLKRTVASIRKKFASVDNTLEVQRAKEILDNELYAPLRDLLQDDTAVGKTFAAMQTEVNAPFSKQLELSGAQATSGMVKRHGKRGFLTEEAALKGEVVWRHDPAAMQGFFKNLGENPNAVALSREIVEELPKRQMSTMEAIAKHYDLGEAGAAKMARARELVSEMDEMLKKGHAQGVLRRQVADATAATRGTGINVGSGAIAGGILGGPLGAVLGAVVGAFFDPVRAGQQLSTVQRLLGAQRLDVVRRVGGYVKSATRGAVKAARHAPPQVITRQKAAETRKARVDAYRKQLSGLSRVLTDPDAAQRELMSAVRGIDYAAPRAAQAMQAQAMRVAGYLHDRMAKPMRPPPPFARRDTWEPSDVEIARAEALTRAAVKPSSILDDLERGTLTGEQVDAVRELHPHVYQQIVDELTDRLSSLQEDLPYDERIRLTVLFGVPVEPSASPEMMATWQETHAATKAAKAEARAPTEATAKAIGRVASESMTQTQRLESKA